MMKTLLSVISCPREQTAYISLGNPCETSMFEYQVVNQYACAE